LDLEALLDHIIADNPAAASHVDLLAAFPHIGSPVKRRAGIRKILHTPVRVYYQIHDERRNKRGFSEEANLGSGTQVVARTLQIGFRHQVR
jgi:plasmid stabilization system protein ParE